MKKLLNVLFVLTFSFCFSQTSTQLIDSIIKVNEFHTECTGPGCWKSKQYLNWEKLKSKLSTDEIVELSKHQNPVIRTYAATELIQTSKYPLSKILNFELTKPALIETLDGCLGDYESTSSVIYNEYWNKIRFEALEGTSNNDSIKNLVMSKKVKADIEMKKTDSIIIFSKNKVDPLLYGKALSNRTYSRGYNSRILELLLNYNDFVAFNYLNKHYPKEYDLQFRTYFKTKFLDAKFETENEIYDLLGFIDFLVESEDSDLKKIAINKLKKDDSWKAEEDWFMKSLEKNGIKF
ncbi:hypothetical protein D1816_02640 [Aquimarina sp. AD10]|uniref:hypothetical protein n=1 Tax=Aquimarina sp. AD10 TaxID=1714849 RepID=UPI000E4AD3FF|nr:hypothetical protein [Aquimarina sp. AD10]AXT59289.1 hypothetical protein D1816_02640 [Aquimarina sp. AD10]RKM95204.1 hypothetical protein D7033_17350 [Aquimarina sp. AD10]